MHYLGIFNYFRYHIPLISRLTAPLDALRNSNDVGGNWTSQCQANFDTLKELLLKAPLLSFPDFDQIFCMATDASDVGISAVLYQVSEGQSITTMNSKHHQYIIFQAQSLKSSEQKY